MAHAATSKIATQFSADEVAGRVRALGGELRAATGNGEVFLLGILKGASVFLGDLLRTIQGDVGYGFIDVVRDEADTEIATALEIDFMSHIELAGRNVFILKDVVSTGVIESYLLTQLRLQNPASMRLVALIDRPNMRTMDLNADYRAFEVGEGTFVGYGLEHEGKWGNLPYIGKL